MKKLCITLITICLSKLIFCQVEFCPEPSTSIEVTGKIPVDFEPEINTEDIWGAPEFDVEDPADRLVIWVHGLSGQGDDAGTSEISWLKASTSSETGYWINSVRPDYNDASLIDAAAELKSDIEIQYGDAVNENTFIIAHSQGGIVSRRIDQAYETGEFGPEPRTFHGLVTFGTPHQGALIINHIEQFYPWVEAACDDLSAGPLEEFTNLTFLGGLLELFTNVENVTDFFCYDLVPIVVEKLTENLDAPIASDYAVNATPLIALNEFEPTIPYVCFYGVESDPLIWHTLVHIMSDHLPNDFEPFMATNDETLAEDMEEMTLNYWSKYIEWDEEADYWESFFDGDDDDWFEVIPLVLTGGIYYFFDSAVEFDKAVSIRNAWKVGYDWLTNANPTWRAIIGADTYVVGEEWTCQCIDETEFDLVDDYYPIEPGEECDPEWGDCMVNIGYIVEEVLTDGVVWAASAATVNGLTYSKVMTGSNHFSMRNDEMTELRLDELFSGSYGAFFITNPR